MVTRILKTSLKELEYVELENECFIQGHKSAYGVAPTLFDIGQTENAVYVPFAYAKKRWKTSPNKHIVYPSCKYQFHTATYAFRNDQESVFNDAVTILKKHRSLLLSLHCGYGKTMLGIRLAWTCKLKTAVLAHRGVLIDQWVESIHKFTDASVQIVSTTGELDESADFYIFNTAFVPKKWSSELKKWIPKKNGIYKSIGLLIVDEAHIACASEMSKALLYFAPRMCIALTATPNRQDGMDKLLELHFGDPAECRIIRTATSPFTVYKLMTGIKPVVKKTKSGTKDWNSVISSLLSNPQRNQIIINLIQKFHNYNIIVLTKRKDHCKTLATALDELCITNTTMVGQTRTYDKSARVLLSTYSKLGTGFDDARLNMLIVAFSVIEIEQYAGRLRDGVNKDRIVVDLVDDDGNCMEQWTARREWYKSRNGIIKNYHTCFPKRTNAALGEPKDDVAAVATTAMTTTNAATTNATSEQQQHYVRLAKQHKSDK